METHERISNRMMMSSILVIALVCISLLDYKTRRIPDGITLLGIVLVLNLQLFKGDIHLAVIGMSTGIGVVWIMNCLKIQKLGGGDAKLLALVGACLGWEIVIATAIIARLISLPFKRPVAYAPFISIGVIICLTVR